MISFGSHLSRAVLFVTSLTFLFPNKDLAFPLIQNATNLYANFEVQCNYDISWVDAGYSTADCRQALDDFYSAGPTTMGRRPVEFTAPGYIGHSGLPVVTVPAKIRSGLSFALIATLD